MTFCTGKECVFHRMKEVISMHVCADRFDTDRNASFNLLLIKLQLQHFSSVTTSRDCLAGFCSQPKQHSLPLLYDAMQLHI